MRAATTLRTEASVQAVEPFGESGERLYREHGETVIERLHIVK